MACENELEKKKKNQTYSARLFVFDIYNEKPNQKTKRLGFS